MADKTQYEALVIPEHAQQPNYIATIDASVQGFVDEQNEISTFSLLFDLDVAVGVQLDAVGVRVGRNRFVITPLANVFFSWDIAGLGWEQGYWQGQFDPTTGVTALDDTTYRALLRAIIVANMWNGTLIGGAAAYTDIFNSTDAPGTGVFVIDNLDMTMTVALYGTMPPLILQALLAAGEIDLKPVGVLVNYFAPSVWGDPLFGLDSETSAISGMDVGAWASPLVV